MRNIFIFISICVIILGCVYLFVNELFFLDLFLPQKEGKRIRIGITPLVFPTSANYAEPSEASLKAIQQQLVLIL